jgi:peroxiredoxin
VFDPAAQNNANSIAKKLYQVSGIPTTYVIDANGNVAASWVGYQENDKRIDDTVKKLLK